MPCPSLVALRALCNIKVTHLPGDEPWLQCENVNELPGLFVTIEGIEGAGKSTLAHALAAHLRSRGRDVVLTAEPGGDPVAHRIRQVLLDTEHRIADRAELLLFEAARAQHVESIILPALARGAVVVCDRFADSSVAYQGCARGLDGEAVKALNQFATRCLNPDLTILLDLPAEQGLAREVKPNRVSAELVAFHDAVRQGFLALAECEPERFIVIDASLGPQEVLDKALAAIRQHEPVQQSR